MKYGKLLFFLLCTILNAHSQKLPKSKVVMDVKSQMLPKSNVVVDGKSYTIYHDYILFDNTEQLSGNFKSTKVFEGYFKRSLRFSSEEVCLIANSTDSDFIYTWQHYLALNTKEFRGNIYDCYNIPFVGQCTKHIQAIIINGKRHLVDNKDDIFFRQQLKLEMGYNRVFVNVELEHGIILKGQYIEINIEKVDPALDINVK